MAIYLFKLIRRKLREREAQKAIPTTDDSHLVPELVSAQELRDCSNQHSHEYSQDSTRSHVNFLTPEEAAQQNAEAHRRKMRQLKLMLGLVLPNFLAAMDVTIVAPAIPLISSHFGMSIQEYHLVLYPRANKCPQTSSPEASTGL
jgi:type II secretory pathway component PulL